MIILDYKDRRPLYEQIVEKFSDLILKGAIILCACALDMRKYLVKK